MASRSVLKMVVGFAVVLIGAVNSASAESCLFGEQTADAFDLEYGNPRVLAEMKARGLKVEESISPVTPEVLDDVSSEAIDLFLRGQFRSKPSKTELAQAWEDFRSSDGYVQYITKHGSTEYGYISVGSYPGDNEYGAVYVIIPLGDGLVDLRKVADIGDSFFENCTVR
jgi:hypothetical protein